MISQEKACGEQGDVQVTLRHVTTLVQRVVSIPADARIRDVKKLLVRRESGSLVGEGVWLFSGRFPRIPNQHARA